MSISNAELSNTPLSLTAPLDIDFRNHVTIPNTGMTSDPLDLGGFQITGIITPAGWTAADLCFQISNDSTSFYSLFTTAGEVKIPSASIPTGGGQHYIALDPAIFQGIRFILLASGIEGARVAQGADRIIYVVTRPRGSYLK